MESLSSCRGRIRSGVFDVDLDSGEMHKSGRRVPLQDQPFRVLAVLLERPGEVITREELEARLWPSDSFVGFDEGINTAIRKLRIAFGDAATNPDSLRRFPGADTVSSRPSAGGARCRRHPMASSRPNCYPQQVNQSLLVRQLIRLKYPLRIERL